MASDDAPLILVVEDDAGVAVLQRRRLERAGFRVVVVNEIDAALTHLSERRVDLVVMDYRLGQTTGLDLHRRMKAAGHDVPVIIVSASMEDQMVIEAIRAGVRDVVLKNTDYLDYLPEAVRGVLTQAAGDRFPERSVSPRVLIVEDDAGVATLEKKYLERAGYQAVIAGTASEAMETACGGDISAAVLDLRLPGDLSGIELYERLVSEGCTVPAILVTAFPDQAVAIRALRAGIRDFVPKTGDFLEYVAAAVDRVVTQSRVERKLLESELRLASIIATAIDAILMCDADQRIVLFNRSAEEMFGVKAGDALGRSLREFVPDIDLGALADDSSVTAAADRRQEVDGVRANGGRVPIELSVSGVTVHGRRLFTVIARDISERRRIEAELREADRRKDQFLGMLAHELRNPLAAIMTAGEVLKLRLTDPAMAKPMAVVTRQAKALARMVDDLLDVSRVTLGKIILAREPLRLQQLVSRVSDSVRDMVQKAGLQLDVQVSDEPLWLHGDATRLEQVLTNLLQNAVKFTPAGGLISLSAAAEDGEAVIRVRDTGVGMERELLPKVFDLFVQADQSLDRSKSGLGIGLALVRQIVTLHGGRVEARSDGPGKGSEFVVRLPRAEAPHEMPDAAHAVVPPTVRPTQVLVVDDQTDIADSLALLLTSLGHHARAVYDGPAALDASRERQPDVMFIDLGMPKMTGFELARRVRDDPALKGVHLVALTGYGRDEDLNRASEAGFDLHLTKPASDVQLQLVLSQLAERPRPVREA